MNHLNAERWRPTLENRPYTFYERMDAGLGAGVPLSIIAAALTLGMFGYPFLEKATHQEAEGLFFMLLILGIPSFLISCQSALMLLLIAPFHSAGRRREEAEWARHGFYRQYMPPAGYDVATLTCISHDTIATTLREAKLEECDLSSVYLDQ